MPRPKRRRSPKPVTLMRARAIVRLCARLHRKSITPAVLDLIATRIIDSLTHRQARRLANLDGRAMWTVMRLANPYLA